LSDQFGKNIHSTPPPTKPARNRESVKELKPAVVPPKWGDARNGGAAEVDTTDGHTARAVDRKIVRRQEASASARCAEIAQVTGDSLLVEHREAGKRRTDAHNGDGRAASIMVAAEAESAAIVVAIALEERAVDIAFGTEDDSVPLPVVASLAAAENAGASHRDKVGCRIGGREPRSSEPGAPKSVPNVVMLFRSKGAAVDPEIGARRPQARP
jgi:hypothetical protein